MKSHTKALVEILTPINPKHGAEVGVWRGENAKMLLRTFPDLHLFLIDNYYPEFTTDKQKRHGIEKAWTEAYDRLGSLSYRHSWMNMTSYQASRLIDNGDLDFAFIDASHDYDSVKADIQAWLPKIREGGILCGHDYGGTWKGVKQAVDEEFGTLVKTGPKKSRVWWIVK